MYKNSDFTSGFAVTYEMPDEFADWPPQTHLFGFDDQTENQEIISLQTDLEALAICHDQSSKYPENDFEGFVFYEYGGAVTELYAKCMEFELIDLSR